jgi:hypothetical protein
MRLRVKFGEVPGAGTIPAGYVQVDDKEVAQRPVQAVVAEAVERLVRRGLEGGKHRSVQVEPQSFAAGEYSGVVYLANADNGGATRDAVPYLGTVQPDVRTAAAQ